METGVDTHTHTHSEDGSRGKHFGNIFLGVQPTFGYEGDPMRRRDEGGELELGQPPLCGDVCWGIRVGHML